MKNSWDERYSTSTNLFGISPNEFLVSQQDKLRSGMKTLAIGDGEAHNGIWLAQQGLNVTSVDVSNVAAEKAKRNAAQADVSIDIIQADIVDFLSPDKKYDLIVHLFVHITATSKTSFHQKMINALNPKGYIIFECFHKAQLQVATGGPREIDMLYDEEEMCQDFKQLDIISLQKVDTNVFEESKGDQPGVSLQFIGRKK